jgi:hypothetical protein
MLRQSYSKRNLLDLKKKKNIKTTKTLVGAAGKLRFLHPLGGWVPN